MVLLGIVLLLFALLFAVKVLFWLGLVLVILGLVLNFGPVIGGPVDGPRRRYW